MSAHRGLVEEVGSGPLAGRVRVRLPQEGGFLTDWLPVGQMLALGAQAFAVPRKGTQVWVLLDEDAEDGVVLCAVYSQADPPPTEDPALLVLRMDDGSSLTYDPGAKRLVVDLVGDAEITVAGLLQAKGRTIRLEGAVEVQGDLKVSGDLEGQGKASFQGDLSTAGDLVAAGRTPAHHEHPVVGGTAQEVP